MSHWTGHLAVNPIPTLLAAGDEALVYFVSRDLLGKTPGPTERLWDLPRARQILRKQQPDGSWRYPGQNRNRYPETNYDLLETFRNLSQLVDKSGLSREHPAVARAAGYVLACQTDEGDIRGILGTQYMPYYHAVLLEQLIKAGYGHDAAPVLMRGRTPVRGRTVVRGIEKGLDWLLAMRQTDGGWIVPAQAVPPREKTRELWSAPPIPPDRTRPLSHLATGMVLRAFAVHPTYRHLEPVRNAGALLKARFFQADRYNDRKAPGYWTKFQFPFWWPNILTALDSLSLIGFPADDADIQRGLDWFRAHQSENGLWQISYEQTKRREPTAQEREAILWVGLAVCRVFKRFYG